MKTILCERLPWAAKRRAVILAAGAAMALAKPADGIINPRFTPADLVRSSRQIVVLRVSAPRGTVLAAEAVRTLKGEAPPQKTLTLDFAGAEDLTADDVAEAFGEHKTRTAVLFVAKPRGPKDKSITGAIQIHTDWFALAYRKGRWRLDKDQRDLVSVWAGSARLLARAAERAVADPTLTFPVACSLRWAGERHLGRLKGPANGCTAADLGGRTGSCAIVLSDGGDRVFAAGGRERAPTDVTDKLKLATASQTAALGDFNGDGRLDLASWDGKAVRLALRRPDGTFAPPSGRLSLPGCASLAAVDAGSPSPSGLIAGSPGGAVLVVVDGQGGLRARAIASAAPGAPLTRPAAAGGLGPGGLCAVADLNGDGRCDVLQLFARGLLFYAGRGAGRFAAPARTRTALVTSPAAAVCGDYDADGSLDVVTGGADGLALLTRDLDGGRDGRWRNETFATGELAYHGGGRRFVTGQAPCDVNHDGRQGVVLFYRRLGAMAFFNRGFACFGLARELLLTTSKLKGAAALQSGQSAGTMIDLNADGCADLLAVSPAGDVWVLFGASRPAEGVGLMLAAHRAQRGPVTVGVSAGGRRTGMYVVRPGAPAFVACAEPGAVLLEWKTPDGRTQKRRVEVESLTRFVLPAPRR